MTMRLEQAAAPALALIFLLPANATATPPLPEPTPIAKALTFARVGPSPGIDLSTPARRFGLAADWLGAVVQAESGGDPLARSPKGAVGLMQLMPGTYAEMRRRLGLGADPWSADDNLAAGAAYLRLLTDRYGATGGLAAYNAGPARFERWLNGSATLPSKTRAYVARVRSHVGGLTDLRARRQRPPGRLNPLAASLFVPLPSTSGAPLGQPAAQQPNTSAAPDAHPGDTSAPSLMAAPDPLFAVAHPPADQR